MAAIHDLLAQVQDEALRARLEQEINRLSKTKKFGLVFEEHLPECTPLYDISVKRGSTVAKRTGTVSDMYEVNSIDDGIATCYHKVTGVKEEFSVEELVSVAQFGEPIYPYLKPIDSICNAPDSDLWHTLIEADNYHALQLLEYLYAGKVDCIYIDPPYNKVDSNDWKYNCNYVDNSDAYRHSKWLSMMEKRLKLAKKLLNPNESVLIITIDEEEYVHLGCLLEELFPEATIQMITDIINPRGTNRGSEFSRVEEYVYICRIGNSVVSKVENNMLGNTDETGKARVWYGFNRGNNLRASAPGQFFPIYIDESKKKIIKVGEALGPHEPQSSVPQYEGLTAVLPINSHGNESIWGAIPETTREWIKKGYIRISGYDKKHARWTFSYIRSGLQQRLESGEVEFDGYAEDGSINLQHLDADGEVVPPKSVWYQSSHKSYDFGSTLIKEIIPNHVFSFPKSIYSTHDAIRFFVENKPNALIVDFFAGSGTTLHAVNLLNKEDGGHRRCILVTNNEIGLKAEKIMKSKGYNPGDEEWEKIGIARFITWPRTICSIMGKDVNGKKLEGSYFSTKLETVKTKRSFTQIPYIDYASLSTSDMKKLVSLLSEKKLPSNLINENKRYIVSEEEKHTVSILLDDTAYREWIDDLYDMTHITDFIVITKNQKLYKQIKNEIEDLLGEVVKKVPMQMPMSDGFEANAAYFKLGFLDKTSVALGRQLKELMSVLWLKAGAHGPCPELQDEKAKMLILPENEFAVLIDEKYYPEFDEKIANHPEIQTLYFVTDSDGGYREMISGYDGKNTYQLYRDYLDNFRINTGR